MTISDKTKLLTSTAQRRESLHSDDRLSPAESINQPINQSRPFSFSVSEAKAPSLLYTCKTRLRDVHVDQRSPSALVNVPTPGPFAARAKGHLRSPALRKYIYIYITPHKVQSIDKLQMNS